MKEYDISRACGTHGGEWKSIQGFVEKCERERLLEKPRHRCEHGNESSGSI
jgi:hypothetical protein